MQITKNKSSNIVITTTVILLGSLGGEMIATNQAQAIGVTRSAVSVSGTIGERNSGSRTFNNLIDQSGLSANYTNNVTEFDTYTSTTTANSANSASTGFTWQSNAGTTTGFLTFDLGDNYSIDAVALWNFGGNNARNIVDFELYSDNDADSSNGLGTLLGTFNSTPGLIGPTASVIAEVFEFNQAINTQFIQMSVISNNGDNLGTRANEVVFRQDVPEPLTILGSFVALGFGGFFKKKSVKHQ